MTEGAKSVVEGVLNIGTENANLLARNVGRPTSEASKVQLAFIEMTRVKMFVGNQVFCDIMMSEKFMGCLKRRSLYAAA